MVSIDNSSQFSLIIGDSHIPRRAKEISPSLCDSILDFVNLHGKFHKVFCTGDIVQSKKFIDFLESIDRTKNILIVQGNMDYYNGVNNPVEQKYIFKNYEEITFGMIHGHQISPRGDIPELLTYAKKMGVNCLISGHTHSDFIIIRDDVLLINPGSCVGAWSFIASGIPSYILIILNREKEKSITMDLQVVKYNRTIEKANHSFRFENGGYIKL